MHPIAARWVARPTVAPIAFAAALAVALATACDRKPAPAPADSTPAPAPVAIDSAPPPTPTSTWDSDAGTALLIPGEQGEALVVVPGSSDGGVTDTSSGRAEAVLPAEVALFTRAGAAGQARAVVTTGTAPDTSEGCSVWPLARLGPASGADAVPRWTVGFVGGHAAPIPLDSLEGLASADSAALAAALSRAAAGLPGDTARRVRGLPFAVRSARRFSPEPGVETFVAVLARTVNQEASPFAEHVLLVAERARGGTGPLAVAYHERAVGVEETLESPEVLAAVRLGADEGGRPTLVLSRDYYEGSAYTLLEREGARRWRVRWTSAYRGC
jgi:hypothetical protein